MTPRTPALQRLTGWVLGRPVAVMLTMALATGALGYGMGHITADTDVTNDLPRHIPAKRLYDRISELFPAKEMVIVGIEDRDIFTVKGAQRLARLTRSVERIPAVQSVISPTNARIIRGTEGGMEVREAADPLPRSAGEVRAWRARLLDQPMLRGTVVSKDGAVAMLVFVKAGMRDADAAEALIRLAQDPARNEGLTLHVAGRGAATYWAKVIMGRDMGMLSTVALLVVILLLLFTFRSLRGVVLPLGVVVSSVIWTLGLMGYLGIPITHSTEVMPILLIAIGVADGIHILKGYYSRARGMAHTEGREGSKQVVLSTMEDLNRPVVLTSVTTAIGFLALNTSGIESIMMLGFLTAFGVVAAMIFSMLFIPAALSLMRLPRGRRNRRSTRFEGLEAAAAAYATMLVRRRGAVALFVIAVVGLAILGATRVPVEMSNMENFRSDHPLRRATEMINRHFGGTTNLMIVARGKGKDAVKDPAMLAKMDALERFLRRQPHVGSVQSLTDFIKQMHRVMHGDRPEQYRLPRKTEQEHGTELVEVDGREVEREVTFEARGRDLVAQYLALYEMSAKPGDFANMVTYDYSTAKINVFLDSDRASVLNPLSVAVRKKIRDIGLTAELTGMAELLRAVNEMVITGQGWSIATSILLVFLAASLMFRSPTLGLFATLPLFFSLFLNFGVMGLGGIALNVMTMATSSVAVGVGIDYAIHFVHRYQHERLSGRDFGDAVVSTMRGSGVAISLNALTVAAGFMALVFSEFTGVAQMGLLIALTMVTSAFAALTILPVLFVWLRPRAFTRATTTEMSQ